MKIEDGNFYKKRNGEVVGPIKKICDTSWSFWIPSDSYMPYRKDGMAKLTGWIKSEHDLVEQL